MIFGNFRTRENSKTETSISSAGKFSARHFEYVAGPPISGGYKPVVISTRMRVFYPEERV